MSVRQIAGFEVIETAGGEGVRVVAPVQRRATVLAAGLADPDRLLAEVTVQRWIPGGRVPHPVIRVGHEEWVIKSYRRGGLVARWNEELYFDTRRFFRELEVSALAARSGIPTADPVALVVKKARFGGVRAWMVTRLIADSISLRDSLAAGDLVSIRPCFRAAGEVVRRLHVAGIDHPDLNLGNILVTGAAGAPAGSDPIKAFIVDWDRARTRDRECNFALRNLLRLHRSGRKLQPDPGILGPSVRAFLRGYFGGPARGLDDTGLAGAAGVRRLRQYYRRRKFLECLHRSVWR